MKGEKRPTYEILRVSEGSIGMKTPERAVLSVLRFLFASLLYYDGYSEGL